MTTLTTARLNALFLDFEPGRLVRVKAPRYGAECDLTGEVFELVEVRGAECYLATPGSSEWEWTLNRSRLTLVA